MGSERGAARGSLFLLTPSSYLLLWRFRERAIVLGDKRLELLRHLVGAREQDITVVGVDHAAETVLEPLESFGHKGLQPRQLREILVDTFVIERAQRFENRVELPAILEIAAIPGNPWSLATGRTTWTLAHPSNSPCRNPSPGRCALVRAYGARATPTPAPGVWPCRARRPLNPAWSAPAPKLPRRASA